MPKINWMHDHERPASLTCTDKTNLSPCETKFLRLIDLFGFSQMNSDPNSKGIYLDLLLTRSCNDFRIYESDIEANLDRISIHHKPYCIEYFDFNMEQHAATIKKVPIIKLARTSQQIAETTFCDISDIDCFQAIDDHENFNYVIDHAIGTMVFNVHTREQYSL